MHQHDEHPHGEGLPTRHGALVQELVDHLPFSVSAVAIGLTIAGIICFLTPPQGPAPQPGLTLDQPAPADAHGHGGESVPIDEHEHGDAEHEHRHDNPFQPLFHVFHPAHMLFSAAATTAMFWRYERRVIKALVIGLIGAIGICGLSDIVMPQLSLGMLGKRTPWHVCVYEHPSMVLSFAAVGVMVGLAASAGVHRSTFFSHSLHVFCSTMASTFYLIGPLGQLAWIDDVGVVFLFIIVAVMVPCCLSDIVFPLFLAQGAKRRYNLDEHTCCT